MYLVPIAWMYVVLMVAIVEATAPNGTWLGALWCCTACCRSP